MGSTAGGVQGWGSVSARAWDGAGWCHWKPPASPLLRAVATPPAHHPSAAAAAAARSEVYALWAQRIHWPDWFGFVEEIGFKEGDDSVCALNLWYRWGERYRRALLACGNRVGTRGSGACACWTPGWLRACAGGGLHALHGPAGRALTPAAHLPAACALASCSHDALAAAVRGAQAHAGGAG